jgi:hypothetical protein
MEFTASPADVERIAVMARKIDANPVRVVGRLVGLGADEQVAGIPGWAWAVLLAGGGVLIGIRHGDQIKQWLRIE